MEKFYISVLGLSITLALLGLLFRSEDSLGQKTLKKEHCGHGINAMLGGPMLFLIAGVLEWVIYFQLTTVFLVCMWCIHGVFGSALLITLFGKFWTVNEKSIKTHIWLSKPLWLFYWLFLASVFPLLLIKTF